MTSDRSEPKVRLPNEIEVYEDGSVLCLYEGLLPVAYHTERKAAAAHHVSAKKWKTIPRRTS